MAIGVVIDTVGGVPDEAAMVMGSAGDSIVDESLAVARAMILYEPGASENVAATPYGAVGAVPSVRFPPALFRINSTCCTTPSDLAAVARTIRVEFCVIVVNADGEITDAALTLEMVTLTGFEVSVFVPPELSLAIAVSV